MNRPTLAQVADALAAEGMTVDRDALRRAAVAAGDEPETHSAPWFVRVFVGLGTWVGGILVTAFLLAMEIYEAPVVAGILGLILIGGAAFVTRRGPATVFRTQLVWVLAIAGQALIIAGVAESTRDEKAASVAGVLLQIACVAVVPDRSLRALCTAALVVALSLMALAFELSYSQEVVIVLATAATLAVWVYESRIGASRLSALWAPAAYALPLGLAFPHGVLVVVHEAGRDGWLDFASSPWLVSVALALLGAWVVSVAVREQSSRPARAGMAAVVGLILVTVATRHVPGVTTGFLLLILAHMRRRRGLEAIGLLYLAGFLGVFYYQLAATLLAKSLWILGAGGVLLAGALMLDRVSGSELARARLVDRSSGRSSGRRAWLRARGGDLVRVAVLAGVCLAIPGGLVAHKEHVLATGRPVYLDLLPRDPRSLMQGDYMVLRYALEPDVLAQNPARGKGTLVVTLDERGVAHLARVSANGQPLAPSEQLLRFRHLPDGESPVRIGAESFFFEEGTADVYARARYGKLVVDAAGRSVLVGLADENLAPLGASAH
jgi:uncharacterized membrane-anchored protein